MDVLIWGCNRFAKTLLKHLKNSPIEVMGFISENKLSSFCGKPVFTPNQLPNSELPIIVSTEHYVLFSRPILRNKNILEFTSKLLEITHDFQIKNPLYHPAALIDFIDLKFKNKVILFGMQGSGNVVFVNILQSLYKMFFPFFVLRASSVAFFELMCREYMNLIHGHINHFIHLEGGHEVRAVAWKIGSSHFNFRFGDEQSQLYSFMTREHLFSFVSMYHQIPSLTYLQKLKRQKFNLFFVLRNPLDIIVSGINKSGGIKNEKMDREIFKCVSRWVIDQLNEWYPLIHQLETLRYENLLKEPIATIKSLMKKTGLVPLRFIAKKIWRKHAFKQLPHAFKHHFWSGGIGKWENYFTDEHLSYLKTYGIEAVLEKYNYPDILQRFKEKTKQLGPCMLEDFPRCFYRDEKYDTFTFFKRSE